MTSIILIVLDSMREDIFWEEGGDALVEHRADKCYAPSHYTLPSHGSMLSGELPSETGVHSYDPDYRHIQEKSFTAQIPQTTYCVSTNNGFLSESYGFDTLFDNHISFSGNYVVDPDGADPRNYVGDVTGFIKQIPKQGTIASLKNGLKTKVNTKTQGLPIPRFGDYGTSTALDFYRPDDEYFLFINLIETHGPFERTLISDVDVSFSYTSRAEDMWDICNGDTESYTEFIDNYRALYRERTRYVIKQLKDFINEMEEQSDELVTIITADHGESFGTNGMIGHRDLVTPVLRIPFGIRGRDMDVGTMSLLQLPDIIHRINAGERIEIDEDVVWTEMVGNFSPPDENKEYWNRCARAAYDGDVGYRWDNLGNIEKLTLDGVEESSETIESVPEKYRLDIPFPDSEQNKITDEAAQHLKDLGYI